MPVSKKSRNLGILARRFAPYRQRAVMAIEIGQEILMAGLVSRAPRGATHKLVKSIRKTKVFNDHKKHRLVGRVIVTAPYAVYQEYGTKYMKPHPFVRPTQAIDGPIAVHVMGELLRR